MTVQDELDKLKNSLIGRAIRISHPITALNPREINEIVNIKIDRDKFFIMGVDTCWFEANSVQLVEHVGLKRIQFNWLKFNWLINSMGTKFE